MNFAELFINLTVKNGPADKALKQTKGTLGEIKTSAVAATLAISAIFYKLEKMVAQSNALGMGLSQFNALTGQSTEMIQQWQYAGRQFGATNEDIAGSFKAVQQAMTAMQTTGSMPEYYGFVQEKVGLDTGRLDDTKYVMQQLDKYAKTVPPQLASQVLKSFGVSEKMIGAMLQDAFTDKRLSKAPKGFSLPELHHLRDIGAAWDNLGTKIERAVARLNLNHGGKMIQDLNKFTDSALRLANALLTLSESLKLFQGLSWVVEKMADLTNKSAAVGEAVGNVVKGKDTDPLSNFKNDKTLNTADKLDILKRNMKWLESPSTKGLPQVERKPQAVEINQNFNFSSDGSNADEVGDAAHDRVKDAYYQISAQGVIN